MENVSAYKKSMNMIIDNNTSKRDALVISNVIFSAIDNLVSLEEEHRLSFGESRIDMALTQTSINLNAVNHNQEVRNKYEQVEEHYKVIGDINPKEEEPVVEKEMVKVKVEEEAKPKKGHLGTVILAIFIILVIIATGFGAYYFLTNYID